MGLLEQHINLLVLIQNSIYKAINIFNHTYHIWKKYTFNLEKDETLY